MFLLSRIGVVAIRVKYLTRSFELLMQEEVGMIVVLLMNGPEIQLITGGRCHELRGLVDSFAFYKITFLQWTPILEWCMVVTWGSWDEYQKDVFKRDWIVSSNLVNHSRFNSQHNWGDLSDHLMRKI